MTQDREASESTMAALWSGGVHVVARGRCGPPIPSCLEMKVRGLVV